MTVNVAFSSDQRVSVLKRTAVVWARSRTGTLRDDRRGVRRGRLYGMSVLLPSRHPDNAPGQDPCPSRKRDSVFHERARRGEKERTRLKRRDPVQKHHGMTEEARKRDHRIRSVPFFARSVQHFLDRDAETSSDDSMRRFRNDHTLSSRHRLLEVLHSVIPNLFRDLCFAPLIGRWTVDGQRSLQQRSAGFGS